MCLRSSLGLPATIRKEDALMEDVLMEDVLMEAFIFCINNK
jgi:hypothetical protein